MLRADLAGKGSLVQEVAAEQVTVGQAMHQLGTTHPKLIERLLDETGTVREHINIFVRGELIHRNEGLQAMLRDGDEVVVMQAVSGGYAY